MSNRWDIRITLKPIRRYWSEFEADYVPKGLSPIYLNLLKLAFFWGAHMTITYNNTLAYSQINPRDHRLVLRRFAGEVDDNLSSLHAERRELSSRSPLTPAGDRSSFSE
jgi:hypothetical protein